MDQFLSTHSDRLTREEVARFLPIYDDFSFASRELQADAESFDEKVEQANSAHAVNCKAINDALANLAKAPNAEQLRKAVGDRTDNHLNDTQRLAQLWAQKAELMKRFAKEVEQVAEAAIAESTAKTKEVLRSLSEIGFEVENPDDPNNPSGINWLQLVKRRHTEARRLEQKATHLSDLRQNMPQRLKLEQDGAKHAEAYARAVAERFIAGQL